MKPSIVSLTALVVVQALAFGSTAYAAQAAGHRYVVESTTLPATQGKAKANDESFGEKESLIVPRMAGFLPGRYGHKGELVDALAPSNSPLLSPEAWKAAIDTGGGSVVAGARHLAGDLARSPRIPSMVPADAMSWVTEHLHLGMPSGH